MPRPLTISPTELVHSHVQEEPDEAEKQRAISQLRANIAACSRESLFSSEKVTLALDDITTAIQDNWNTHGGARLRNFIWSIWNDLHCINLNDLRGGLDPHLSEAVAIVFSAHLTGGLSEDMISEALSNSGEFDRWEQERARTPEHETVVYPSIPYTLDTLQKLLPSLVAREQRNVPGPSQRTNI